MQLHFCGRLDDIAHQETEHLVVHPGYPDCLVGCVKWSRDMFEERDSPKQMMMGARNTFYCIILGLGLFLMHGGRMRDNRVSIFLILERTPTEQRRLLLLILGMNGRVVL